MPLTAEDVIDRAALLRPRYELAVRGVPFEEMGVLHSEMLFLLAAVGEPAPERIVESGRARAQSTHLLAVCFPGSRVVSIEVDPTSPDAAVAAERLRGLDNVELLFGDSRRLMPSLVRPGDVVVIDGPKGYRGLKLAVALLRRCRPRLLFMHDCHRGSEERAFLEAHLPGAIYSDEPRFERAHADLDEVCWRTGDAGGYSGWRPHRYKGASQESYGPTYACVPYDPALSWSRLQRRVRLEAVVQNARRSLHRRLARRGAAPAGEQP